MLAWSWRREQETDDHHRLAYNTALLTTQAGAGKLKAFDQTFSKQKPVSRADAREARERADKLSQAINRRKARKATDG
jgi:hypothetical protein